MEKKLDAGKIMLQDAGKQDRADLTVSDLHLHTTVTVTFKLPLRQVSFTAIFPVFLFGV